MFGVETLYEVLFVHVCLVSLAVEEAVRQLLLLEGQEFQCSSQD